jgi:hypothetical protein
MPEFIVRDKRIIFAYVPMTISLLNLITHILELLIQALQCVLMNGELRTLKEFAFGSSSIVIMVMLLITLRIHVEGNLRKV